MTPVVEGKKWLFTKEDLNGLLGKHLVDQLQRKRLINPLWVHNNDPDGNNRFWFSESDFLTVVAAKHRQNIANESHEKTNLLGIKVSGEIERRAIREKSWWQDIKKKLTENSPGIGDFLEKY